jgi:oxygen-independent coproporphyrinogen-3 oxidase
VKPGFYAHIPFCQSKCSYCHFVSYPYEEFLASRYEKALICEIERTSIANDYGEADTIYLGGGTPSLVARDSINRILTAFRSRFHITDDCEISLEANPGTLSKEKIEAFRRIGINRISLGAQSFADQELAAIGRLHTSKMIYEALVDLKEGGFHNVNMDLMLGLPLQTKASWRRNLNIISRLNIPHISIYMLDLDDPCPLSNAVAKGEISIPEDDMVSDLYIETIEFLSSRGYQQYEISNFAQPGYTCRHNSKYWLRDPVIGFGLASHSFDGNSRWANKSLLEDYFDAIENGKNAELWRETVSCLQALQETLFLGLRMTRGIDWNILCNRFGEDNLARYTEYTRQLLSQNLMRNENGIVQLTPAGMLLSNEIFQHFV